MKQNQKNISKFLNTYLKNKKLKNDQYSQGALARDLGISTGALSQILKGKRLISQKMALKFISSLKLNTKEQKELLKNFEIEGKLKEKKSYKDFEIKNLSANYNWVVFALLNIAKLPNADFTLTNLSKQLNVSKKILQQIIQYLIQNEYLIQDAQGKITRAVKNIQTSHTVSKIDKQKIHLENLKLAQKSLLKDQPKDREFTSLTLVFNPEDIEEAKDLIRDFQNKFSSVFETDSAEAVYKLNIQFYSLYKT